MLYFRESIHIEFSKNRNIEPDAAVNERKGNDTKQKNGRKDVHEKTRNFDNMGTVNDGMLTIIWSKSRFPNHILCAHRSMGLYPDHQISP
jgi:hypothetical protein